MRWRFPFLASLVALSLTFPAAAQACVEGTGRYYLFAAPAADIPAPIIVIEGTVVEAAEDETRLRLTSAVKGIPAGTDVRVRRSSYDCGHQWGARGGKVFAMGGFQSFELPNPVFEALPLKAVRPPRSNIRSYGTRKYIVDTDYVRALEGQRRQ